MDLQAEVEVNHIYRGTPFVTFYTMDTTKSSVWKGYMIAIPTKGDIVLVDDSSLEGTVKSITWAFIGESIFAQVILEDVIYN